MLGELLGVLKWRVLSLIAVGAMLAVCWMSRFDRGIPSNEVVPVTLMMLAVTPTIWRAPYSLLRWWEVPGLLACLGLAGWGAWTFHPQDDFGFRCFFSVFVVLALAYAVACTSSAPGTRWRRQVLEPTRRFSAYSLPFLNIGLALAPFLFPILTLRYLWTERDRFFG